MNPSNHGFNPDSEPDFGDGDDDDSRDENPSAADIARFADESAYCPDCGARVWDGADVCPKCHAYIGGNVSHRQPFQKWFNQKIVVLIVIALLIAMLFWLL